jgi:copper chaperone CopZ
MNHSPPHAAQFALSGLTCGGCVKRVQAALAPLAGSVQVTLDPPRATLSADHAPLPALQSAVAAAGGYTLSPLAAAPPAAPTVADSDVPPGWFATYRPLLLILAYLLAASVLVQVPLGGVSGVSGVSGHETMRYFMAGFFLVFSFFKLLDLPAFADAYAGYDLLAARWRGWGLIYPFVELALGLAYLANVAPRLTNTVTLLVMGFSAIGVIRAVLGQKKIRCACLGAVFQLPMSTVTIVEDVGMVAMAAAMLWWLA